MKLRLTRENQDQLNPSKHTKFMCKGMQIHKHILCEEYENGQCEISNFLISIFNLKSYKK